MTALRPVPHPESAAPAVDVEAEVRAIREHLFSARNYLVGRLALLVTQPFGIEPYSARGAVVTGLASGSVRFFVPVLAGLAVGELGQSPIGRWALIATLLGVLDVVTTYRMRQPSEEQTNMTALLETIEKPRDAHELLLFTRRRYRLGLSAAFSVGVSLLALVAFAVVAPSALDALPVGSVVLLAILILETGELVYQDVLFMTPFIARLGRFEHRLFWLSPLDSEPVRRMLRSFGDVQVFVGFGVTQQLVLAVVLVGLDSGLLLPVVALLTSIGYLTIAVLVMAVRRSLRQVATRSRDRNMAVLQTRIDAFGPRLGRLTPAEADELQHLVETYRTVRDASTSASTSETFGHAAKALVIPTVGFLLAVMSEVYAERLLDQLLP